MKTVHEFFTNKRMEDSRFEYSWLHSWMVVFARVESLRARAGKSVRQGEELFQSC